MTTLVAIGVYAGLFFAGLRLARQPGSGWAAAGLGVSVGVMGFFLIEAAARLP